MSDSSQGEGWWQASDGKWYPPEQAAGAQLPQPPDQSAAGTAPPAPQYVQQPAKSSSSGCWKIGGIIVLVFLVLGVIGIVISVAAVDEAIDEANEQIEELDAEFEEDVTGVECFTSDAGFMGARIDVTNNSSDPSTYLIDVEFTDPATGDQIDTSSISTNNLDNGQSTTLEALTLTEPPPGGFECELTEVDRFAS